MRNEGRSNATYGFALRNNLLWEIKTRTRSEYFELDLKVQD